ncbi:FecR domain-containing protein [Variovorax sp.]|jgi:transmembrane sensor|uniref:FecR domain-containing protein n=1 Tax=Variovorax sp. TaxID=1871043 RepID=UPI0037DA0780
MSTVLPDSVIDAAILWSVRLAHGEPTPKMQRAHAQWLEADPRHAQAWQRVGDLRRGFAGMPAGPARDTLQAAQLHRQQRGRRGALKLLSLAGVALGAGWLLREHAPWQRLLADASTGTGEQRTLRLADGTTLVLNTDSAVSTDLNGERRLVVLRRGEIMVSTGDDAGAAAKRPFWVYTPFGRMQALGTRFVVRIDERRARVSVQQGAVALHPGDGPAEAVVQAGQSRWLAESGSTPAAGLGFDEDGWVDGVIAGQNIRMADLLAELGRYRHGVVLCDPAVAELRVSGVFHVRDSDRALQFLAQTQPISVRLRTRYWVSVGPPA